jgi:GNAT superfamily N-acetyltransferase
MQPNEIELVLVQSSDPKLSARALLREYLVWVASVADSHYGLSFDIESMVASDIEDTAKFYPPNGRFYLVMHRGEAVGIGCLKQLSTGFGEIQRMYVQPHVRGAGAGRKLLECLIAEARAMGFHSLRLESLKALEAAHALYHSAGFVDIEPYSQNSMKVYQPCDTLERYRDSAVFMELAFVTPQKAD